MKGESVELPLVPRGHSPLLRIALAPPIRLRVLRTPFLHWKSVQLACIELYGKLMEDPPLYTFPMSHDTQRRLKGNIHEPYNQ